MTEEEKAVFNAAVMLALYCKNKTECSECIFYVDNEGCGVETPCSFRVPAALCDKKD